MHLTPPNIAFAANDQFGDEAPGEETCSEDCLGPDDPGVGPWVYEFYD